MKVSTRFWRGVLSVTYAINRQSLKYCTCILNVGTIIITYGSKGSHRQLRPRTMGDEIASRVLPKEQTHSTEAICMVNALMLERILGTGIFDSPAAFAKMIGISRKLMSDLLSMLNNPPSEIERIIFSTMG